MKLNPQLILLLAALLSACSTDENNETPTQEVEQSGDSENDPSQGDDSDNGSEGGGSNSPNEGETSAPVADITVELEDFINTGGAHEGFQTDTVNSGDSAVGMINFNQTGDWGDYSITFTHAGVYQVSIDAGTPLDNTGVALLLNNTEQAQSQLPNTGGWNDFVTTKITSNFIVTQADSYTLRVISVGATSAWQWNADAMTFTYLEACDEETKNCEDSNSDSSVIVDEIDRTNDNLETVTLAAKPEYVGMGLPVSLPEQNQIQKSAVWYTYGGNARMTGFDDFGANGIFWGHMPEHNFYDQATINTWAAGVANFQNQGLKYTVRGEFDWGWRWFVEFADEPADHYVLNLNLEPVLMSFMGHHEYLGYNNHWLSNNSPLFVPFMKSQVDQMFAADADYIMFDSQTSSTRSTHMNQFGGDFSPYTMTAFREYLNNKYTLLELNAKGVDDPETFDYREFLVDLGYTHQSYMQAANKINGGIPLFDDFIYFNRDVVNDKMQQVFDYIREIAPDIEIGSTVSLMEPRGFLYSEDMTFLAGELPMDSATADEMPTTIITHLKSAEAVNKTLVYFPYPWNFNDLRKRNAPRHARTWIAQSYAMGAIFSIPANVWVGDAGVWQPGADNFRDLYQMARNKEHLLDGYRPYSKVGLVSPVMASLDQGWINGSGNLRSSINTLLYNNLNFDLLVFGDPGKPVMPTQATLDNYQLIVVDDDQSYLTSEQQTLLTNNMDKLTTVGSLDLTQLANAQINVSINGENANQTVSAISRASDKPNTPFVIHLLNRPLTQTGQTPVLDNVMVTIPADYFPSAITRVVLHLPSGTEQILELTTDQQGNYQVSVNELEVWGILELAHQ